MYLYIHGKVPGKNHVIFGAYYGGNRHGVQMMDLQFIIAVIF